MNKLLVIIAQLRVAQKKVINLDDPEYEQHIQWIENIEYVIDGIIKAINDKTPIPIINKPFHESQTKEIEKYNAAVKEFEDSKAIELYVGYKKKDKPLEGMTVTDED